MKEKKMSKEVNEYREKLWFFSFNLQSLIPRKKDCIKFLGLKSYKELVVLEKRLGNDIYSPPDQDILDILEKPFQIIQQYTQDCKTYSLRIMLVGYRSLWVKKTIMEEYK